MAICSGSTSFFDPSQAHSIWATTPSGQFCPYTIQPVICHQSTIFVAWDTAFSRKEDKVDVELWNQEYPNWDMVPLGHCRQCFGLRQ